MKRENSSAPEPGAPVSGGFEILILASGATPWLHEPALRSVEREGRTAVV